MKIIKSYKIFESKESIEDICRKYNIWNWTLNDDGSIDVDGDVDLKCSFLTKLPLRFGRVTGNFNCPNNNLTSLEGSPNWVGGYFNCSFNKLASLEGSPNWVGGYFYCSENKLTNLVGGPNFVGGDFIFINNNLTSLEGCPEKIFGDLRGHFNKIISLDHYPTILTGQFCISSLSPIFEIWKNVLKHKPNNHGHYLLLFQLHDPIRFEGGRWVCYRECLDNFFEEIGVPSPPKLKKYREV